ncbi:MAG: carbon starvation CstA family protein, partial [Planctomycetota bacterium]
STRARLLFLLLLFLALTVVLAVFGLVIAVLFAKYPESVLSVWIEIPIAIAIGAYIKRRGGSLFWPSLMAVGLLYAAIWGAVTYEPLRITFGESVPLFAGAGTGLTDGLRSAVVIWTGILLVYAFVASVLPVGTLLQPRDYINSHQLMAALGLLGLGLIVARPELVAPAINHHAPGDAPPIFPFLFITIACGAVSGFHCLVASGTSSKQLKKETDAQMVGYGAMLLEGALAVVVILACPAGLGLGTAGGEGGPTGVAAWQVYYGGSWSGMSLGQKVGAFVDGGANIIAALGLPIEFAVGVVCVMVASFAATTLDTATRLQRYVIQEVGAATRIWPLTNKYVATTIAVVTGGLLALLPGPAGPGSGGLILWPLFGATNQLLAGLAFLVIGFYLIRHDKPVTVLVIPGALMLILPAWAMATQIHAWALKGQWLLVSAGVGLEVLQVWMVVEGAVLWRKVKGVKPAPLPPLPARAGAEGGRSC